MNHKNYSINNYPLNFYVTYVLKLEGNKYYVGRAQNGKINKRIRQHLNGGGSGWTCRHKTTDVAGIYEGDKISQKH